MTYSKGGAKKRYRNARPVLLHFIHLLANDSFSRCTRKLINGTTTNLVYDGLNPVQEKNGATVTANLLTGLGIDEFFTRTDWV